MPEAEGVSRAINQSPLRIGRKDTMFPLANLVLTMISVLPPASG